MDHVKLREERLKAGITQETMSQELGWKNKASYCLLENGTIKCTVDHAKIIKRVLGLSLEKFDEIFLH